MTFREVARQLVRSTDAPAPARAWDMAEEVQKVRSTDAFGAPLHVCRTAEEARAAALASVTSHCGDCLKSWPGHTIPPHDCRNPAGVDLAPAKRARAAGARRQLAMLRNTPGPPCIWCDAAMPPGRVHECQKDSELLLPHEAIAARWARKGGAAALAADLEEIKAGRP